MVWTTNRKLDCSIWLRAWDKDMSFLHQRWLLEQSPDKEALKARSSKCSKFSGRNWQECALLRTNKLPCRKTCRFVFRAAYQRWYACALTAGHHALDTTKRLMSPDIGSRLLTNIHRAYMHHLCQYTEVLLAVPLIYLLGSDC